MRPKGSSDRSYIFRRSAGLASLSGLACCRSLNLIAVDGATLLGRKSSTYLDSQSKSKSPGAQSYCYCSCTQPRRLGQISVFNLRFSRKESTLRNSRSLVFLTGLVCFTVASLSSRAQKIVVPTSLSSTVSKGHNASPDLQITCQSHGPAGLEFLVATASGGERPYTFSELSGPVEPRVAHQSLFATVPLADKTKTETFTGKVTDKNGKTKPVSCPVTIDPPPAPGDLSLICPGPAHAGAAFQIVGVIGGVPPYTFTATLPKQLSLDPTGLVSGASTPGIIEDQQITVVDKSGNIKTTACTITVLPQSGSESCIFFPVASGKCVGSGIAKNANINTFWGTNGGFVFFNQINSIYNGASNSETVSADIGTLNFPFGMQMNIGSNVQAGASPTVAVSTGTVPTLAPSAAAQAAQNMLYGGTIFASGAYPLLAVGGNRINNPGSWGGMLDVTAREGIDIQSFKAGTSTGLTSPSSHSSAQVEGYFQVNSTNLAIGGSTFAGALFIGGSYGYTYTSHSYIRDYGIRSPQNSVGQISGGVILNGIAKLAFSRAFGPSQTYFDGTATPTPSTPTTINNFKTLSFELSYQSPAPGSK